MAQQDANPYWIDPGNTSVMSEMRATMALAYEVRTLRETAASLGEMLDNIAAQLYELSTQVNKLRK